MAHTGGTAAAAAIAAAIANAIKASGTIVSVEPSEFLKILAHTETPLIVTTPKSFWGNYKYLSSYKGLAFFTKTSQPLMLPNNAQIVSAKKIWIPG